jgi:hypothetical protein
MKFNKRLEELYEQVNYNTYKNIGYEILLDNNITSEKIDLYCDNFKKETLLEVFSDGLVDVVYMDKLNSDKGFLSDRFKFTINDISYFIDVTYMSCEYYLKVLDNDIMMLYGDEVNYNKLVEFKNYIEYNKNKKIVYFDFKTEEIEYNLTGNVKRFSYNVFGSVVRAMRQSLFYNNRLNDICCLYFVTNKSESKRDNIYKAIIKQELPNRFNKQFVDYFSDRKYNKNYIF